jgi:hypothetical protein
MPLLQKLLNGSKPMLTINGDCRDLVKVPLDLPEASFDIRGIGPITPVSAGDRSKMFDATIGKLRRICERWRTPLVLIKSDQFSLTLRKESNRDRVEELR